MTHNPKTKKRVNWDTLYPRLKEVLKQTWAHTIDSQLILEASSLSYTTLLSIVPFLAVSFSIFNTMKGMGQFSDAIEPFILNNLAGNAGKEAIDFIESTIKNIHSGAIGLSGLVALIFTSMSMLSSIENAVNRIWKTKSERTFFNRITNYWFFITIGPISLALVLGILVGDGNAMKMSAWISPLLSVVMLTLMYQWLPGKKVYFKPALISGVFASFFFFLSQKGYALYLKYFVSYDKIYGSLGAIPVLILWILICWIVVLSGAALCATLQNRLEELK